MAPLTPSRRPIPEMIVLLCGFSFCGMLAFPNIAVLVGVVAPLFAAYLIFRLLRGRLARSAKLAGLEGVGALLGLRPQDGHFSGTIRGIPVVLSRTFDGMTTIHADDGLGTSETVSRPGALTGAELEREILSSVSAAESKQETVCLRARRADSAMRLAAVRILAGVAVRSERVTQTLEASLVDADVVVRLTASRVLGRPCTDDESALLGVIRDADPDGQDLIAEQLVKVATAAAIPTLAAMRDAPGVERVKFFQDLIDAIATRVGASRGSVAIASGTEGEVSFAEKRQGALSKPSIH